MLFVSLWMAGWLFWGRWVGSAGYSVPNAVCAFGVRRPDWFSIADLH